MLSRRTTTIRDALQNNATRTNNGDDDEEEGNEIVRLRTKTEKSATSTTTTKGTSLYNRDPMYVYSSLLAGIGSGIVSGIICAPLDLVKTRVQVWNEIAGTTNKAQFSLVHMIRDIIQTDGIRGCFRGLGATLLTVPAFWGVYFPLYDDFKRYSLHHYPDAQPALLHMVSAVAAGAISDLICNPMFVVRTRLQTEAVHNRIEHISGKSSMIQTIKVLYNEGGILTFWRGMTANLLGLSHVAIQFPTYEYLKRTLRKRRQKKQQQHYIHHHDSYINKQPESPIDLLIASACSKMMASIITYPHEVIRSRMMDARLIAGSGTKLSFIQTCQKIYRTEKIAGFYAGLPISLLRVIPNTCMTFITYELFLHYSRQQIIHYYSSNSSLSANNNTTART